ncbi:MAG: hypothetical protein IJS22_00455 [Lachnospiraceae bacterium]|nr:hypothetical protein [Lachnospiraceae bacterium]
MEENKEYTLSKTGLREAVTETADADGAAAPADGFGGDASEMTSGSDAAREPFVSSHTPLQRVLAWIAIGLLLALTVTDLVLAIIGTPEAQLALRITIVLTVLVPIILYFFVLMLKKRKG